MTLEWNFVVFLSEMEMVVFLSIKFVVSFNCNALVLILECSFDSNFFELMMLSGNQIQR